MLDEHMAGCGFEQILARAGDERAVWCAAPESRSVLREDRMPVDLGDVVEELRRKFAAVVDRVADALQRAAQVRERFSSDESRGIL